MQLNVVLEQEKGQAKFGQILLKVSEHMRTLANSAPALNLLVRTVVVVVQWPIFLVTGSGLQVPFYLAASLG